MFQIPNSADVEHVSQAQPDAKDVDILVAALQGTGWVSGCAVTAQGSPNMTVAVGAGVIAVAATKANVSGGNVTIGAAHATLNRFDLVCADSAGTKSVVAGTNAASPVFPDPNAGGTKVVLAAVRVPAAVASINTPKIIDKRAAAVLAIPAAGSITGSQIAATTITASNIANDTLTATQIAANAIGASELADNSVDTAAILDDAVTAAKIAAGAVGTSEIADGTVAVGDLNTAVLQGHRIESGRSTGISISGQSHTDVTVNFGTAFGSAPVVLVTPDNSGDATWLGNGALHIQSVGTSSFSVRVEQSPNNTVSDARVYWLAIGI